MINDFFDFKYIFILTNQLVIKMVWRFFSKKRIYLYVTFVMFFTLILAIFESILNQNWIVLFTSFFVLILISLPLIFRRRYKFRIPPELELITVLFIYMSLFLGEIRGFYLTYWWWDVVLHAGSALVFGFIGFTILFLMYSRQKVGARPILLAIFSFSFAIALGVIWEIFEFSMDQFFGFKMQKSGLMDTMGDLIVDAFGAFLSSIIAFFYFKTRRVLFFREGFKNIGN